MRCLAIVSSNTANSSYLLCVIRCGYGTAQFKLYRCTHVLARLTHAKLQKLACACTVAHSFGVRMRNSKHTRHTRDAHHELALGLPHYTCGVTTGTVAVGNEIQLLCS